MRSLKRTRSWTTSTGVSSPPIPGDQRGVEAQKLGSCLRDQLQSGELGPEPGEAQLKAHLAHIGERTQRRRRVGAQFVGVDLEHDVLRHQRPVERVELAHGDDRCVGQLVGGAAQEQKVVGAQARGRRDRGLASGDAVRGQQARAPSHVKQHIGEAQRRVERATDAAAIADHGRDRRFDDRLEEGLELAALDARGERLLELRVVGGGCLGGGLHGRRQAALQVLLEGQGVVGAEDGRAHRRMHAVVDAGGEIVEQQRLQAFVHTARDGGEVVFGDHLGGPRRRQKHDEGIVGEREVAHHIEPPQGAAGHALEVGGHGVEDLGDDAPAEDGLEAAVVVEADVEDRDLAAPLELEAHGVGDEIE